MIIDNIKLKEVALRIRDHNRIHSKEPGAVIITECLNFAAEIIEKLDRGEIQPVKHGQWVDDKTCSNCGFDILYNYGISGTGFCPNCGAQMDKE